MTIPTIFVAKKAIERTLNLRSGYVNEKSKDNNVRKRNLK